jgi:UDP-N-acetyl-2-amino-2-deoxyglucuronate dehydrogenase
MIQFAIVGCGNIGKKHADLIQKKATLTAVCDIVEERANEFAHYYNAKPYYSIDDLLAKEVDVDVVAITSPNGLHAEHSIKALESRKHVLCEKPMAISSYDCRSMMKAGEKMAKSLFIVKQNRFNPPVVAVKKIIDEGRLGKIYSIQLSCFWNRNRNYYQNSWRGTLKLDGGVLYTQFSHFIDILLWLIGDVKTAKSIMANYAHKQIIEFEDNGIVLLEFVSGALGTINYTINSFEKNMEGSLVIFGEKGTVKIGGQYLNDLVYQNIDNYRIENLPPGNEGNDYQVYAGSMSNHDKVYDHVLDELAKKNTPKTNALDSLKTVELIEKIYKEAIRL